MFAETIESQHEFRHPPDGTPDYNESTYYNFASMTSGVVGWLRVAMQPNQPAGQATALIFLPGQTLFSFERTSTVRDGAFQVGSITIDVAEPHRRQALTFGGTMSVFTDPRMLADPGAALRAAPREQVAVDLAVEAHGEPFGTNGNDPAQVLEATLATGHYEQFIRLAGELRVGERTFAVRGGGLRDHSWGPRNWSGPSFHRWITATFEDGSAIMALEVGRRDGGLTRRAAVAAGGVAAEARLRALGVDWTPDGFGRRVVCEIATAAGAVVLTGTVRDPAQFVPLRHVTTAPDGSQSITRIGYSAYEFVTSDGRRGLGIVEMLDQLVDGRPVGMP
jgi:hypothetical protein